MNHRSIAILVHVLLFAWAASELHSQDFEEGRQLIEDCCFECHDDVSAKGGLNLKSLLDDRPLVKELEVWRNIAKRIELGDMPPAENDVLSHGEKKQFVDWFDKHIVQFDYRKIRNPGYEPVRRLTTTEYRHTIRDLFGANLADTDRFPQDLSGRTGFDNTSNTLFLQRSLFEKYAQSAESIVDQVFASESSELMDRVRQELFRPGEGIADPEARANKIIQQFARRAFRRPATADELSSLLNLYRAQRNQGSGFDEAIRKTVMAILVLPQFLMKTESPVNSSQDQKISQYDLATRISYFLWASMPDDHLLELAERGKLADREVLMQEVDRMMKNRRAKSLGYVFAGQWLGFDDVGPRRRQDPIDNPWCTESLMAAMRAESALFFHSLVRDNASVSDLIDARYTYLNEELANFYRIGGIEGQHMRRVRLKTQIRGGVLTHASVLAATAFPDRTSPVERGKWVLDTLLGTPPPEPPPNVSEISERVLERDDLSFREKVQQHSKNPKCYSCHSEMDPIGFSLENFDNFGRWRHRVDGKKVDAKGKLPDGTEFDGPTGLKQVIVGQRMDDLTRQLTRKMLAYALGRQLEYYDEPAIQEIFNATKADGYRFQTLVKGIINSYPFQHQRKPKVVE